MPILPEEIAGKRFTLAVRGYNRLEVDGFLREVAGQQQRLLRQIEDLQSAIEDVTVGRAREADRALAAVLDDAARSVADLRRSRMAFGRGGAGERRPGDFGQ